MAAAPPAENLSTLWEDAGDVTATLFLLPGIGDNSLLIFVSYGSCCEPTSSLL